MTERRSIVTLNELSPNQGKSWARMKREIVKSTGDQHDLKPGFIAATWKKTYFGFLLANAGAFPSNQLSSTKKNLNSAC
jgi:hypothetical protein